MSESYSEIVAANAIDAFEFDENILEFIDKTYETAYMNCNMDDELQALSDRIHHDNDYEIVEQIYDLACEKYPLVKNIPTLNPRKRYVNSFYVFEKSFDYIIDDRDEDEFEPLKTELINKYPKCEQLILNQFAWDGDGDERDPKWLIPKDEILDEQYEQLYAEGLNYKREECSYRNNFMN